MGHTTVVKVSKKKDAYMFWVWQRKKLKENSKYKTH